MKASIWIFNFYSLFCCFPFDFRWDNGGTVQRTKNKVKRFVSLLAAVLELINMIFLMVTLIKNVKTYVKEQRLLHMTFHSAWCAIIWVCSSNVYAITFLKPYLILLINESLRFSNKIQNLFGPPAWSSFKRQKAVRERLIAIVGCYCVLTESLAPFLVVYFRYQDWYLVNFITPEKWKPLSGKTAIPLMAAILIKVWFDITLWGNFAFISYLHLIYLQTTGAALNLLKYHSPIRDTGIKPKNQIQQKMRIYSELRIMNRLYNNAFKGLVWPMSLTLPCIIFIGGTCSLLRDKSGNFVVMAFNGCCVSITVGFLIASSIFMSKVNTDSENLRHYFVRTGKNTKFNRYLCASFQTIGIEIGSLYVVQKRSLFTLMGMLTNSTVSALLSLNQF